MAGEGVRVGVGVAVAAGVEVFGGGVGETGVEPSSDRNPGVAVPVGTTSWEIVAGASGWIVGVDGMDDDVGASAAKGAGGAVLDVPGASEGTSVIIGVFESWVGTTVGGSASAGDDVVGEGGDDETVVAAPSVGSTVGRSVGIASVGVILAVAVAGPIAVDGSALAGGEGELLSSARVGEGAVGLGAGTSSDAGAARAGRASRTGTSVSAADAPRRAR